VGCSRTAAHSLLPVTALAHVSSRIALPPQPSFQEMCLVLPRLPQPPAGVALSQTCLRTSRRSRFCSPLQRNCWCGLESTELSQGEAQCWGSEGATEPSLALVCESLRLASGRQQGSDTKRGL